MATTNRPNRPNRATGRPAGAIGLPEIRELVVALRRFDPPRIFYIGPERRQIREAVEILVRTSVRIPARAVTPVLFVGDVPLATFEPAGPERYRFFGLEPQRLQAGAPISFGYPHQPLEHRVRTGFTFRLEPPLVS
jgi:hypothetical protein